jgi:hypothetical protein
MWRAVSRLRGARALSGAVRLGSLLASPPTALLPSASLLLPVVVNVGQQSSGSHCSQPWLAMVGLAGAAAALAQPALAMPATASGDADADDTQAEVELAYRVAPAIRTKYGRYPPWCRLNVDQVPLPFVNDMDTTYEERGAKRVTINQLGPALSKRQATGQICFRPAVPPPTGCTTSQARELYDEYLKAQPAPCILFRGKGNISEVERAAYPAGLVVLWQDKAWVDRPLALEWAEDVIKPFVEAERKAGVADTSTRYLLFQDNLDAQKQPDYIKLLSDWGVDDHKLPPNETDQVQPIDRGLGRQVKMYIGQQVSMCIALVLLVAPALLSPLSLRWMSGWTTTIT